MCSRGRLSEGGEMLAISGCNLSMKVQYKICGLVYTPEHVVLYVAVVVVTTFIGGFHDGKMIESGSVSVPN